jgi:hypothetical protein
VKVFIPHAFMKDLFKVSPSYSAGCHRYGSREYTEFLSYAQELLKWEFLEPASMTDTAPEEDKQ